jgi:hypothetical protein
MEREEKYDGKIDGRNWRGRKGEIIWRMRVTYALDY